MIGVIIAGHGRLAKYLMEIAEKIVGEIPEVSPICVDEEDTHVEIKEKVRKAIRELKSEEIIALTDVFGGSATNICASLAGERDIRVITGVNLPMLLELYNCRNIEDIDELTMRLVRAGKNSIREACALMKKK